MAVFARPSNRTSLWWSRASAASLIAIATVASTHSAAAAEDAAQMGDIVVTASKRATDGQKTPLAINALSQKLLDQSHVGDAVDLNGLVPSLVITTSEGFQRNVAIRGIGFNVPQNDAAQPSVSYHVDGIYISNPIALNTGFLDVSRIEVVRGPQGTVYGQNSTGGTLNVVSNLPSTSAVAGNGKLDVGNFGLIEYEGAFNIPVSDTIAVRAAVDVVNRNGFANATKVAGTNGKYDLSDERSRHGRLSLLWQPTDRASLMLRAEYAESNNHNTQGKNILDPDPDPWSQSSDWPGKFTYSNEVYSGTLTYDLGFATLKALGSYQIVRHDGSINEDGMDIPLATALLSVPGYTQVHNLEYLFHHSNATTGEINLASSTTGRLNWILGAFYLRSANSVGYQQYTVDTYPVPGQPTSLPNQLYSGLTSPDQLGLGDYNYFPYFYSLSQLRRESYSLFGQATYRVTDRLRLTGGLRWTHDYNDTVICGYVCAAPVYVNQTEKKVTVKAGIEFDLAPRTLVYASFSTGYKPGGGNISPEPIVIGYQFGSEKIKAYEAGLKTTFLDNRVRLNMAGFYYDYSDLQFEAEDGFAYQGGVANIPKAAVWGLEAELSLILPAGFRFDGSITAEDSKIRSHYLALENVRAYYADKLVLAQYGTLFSDEGRAADIAVRAGLYQDVHGNPVPNLPKMTAQGTLSHTLALHGGVLTSSVSGQYRASYINTVFGDVIQTIGGKSYDIYRTPAHTLMNMFVGYQFPDRKLELSLTVRNVTNNPAVLGRFTNQFGGETTQQYAPPRQVIGSISYKF